MSDSVYTPKHSDEEYLRFNPFDGDEAETTCSTVEIRTARKSHLCFTLTGRRDHEISVGDRYRYERALIDRSFWGCYRLCLRCVDEALQEFSGHDD